MRISLNSTGRHLLKSHHTLKVTLHVNEAHTSAKSTAIATQTLTFKTPRRHPKHH